MKTVTCTFDLIPQPDADGQINPNLRVLSGCADLHYSEHGVRVTLDETQEVLGVYQDTHTAVSAIIRRYNNRYLPEYAIKNIDVIDTESVDLDSDD